MHLVFWHYTGQAKNKYGLTDVSNWGFFIWFFERWNSFLFSFLGSAEVIGLFKTDSGFVYFFKIINRRTILLMIDSNWTSQKKFEKINWIMSWSVLRRYPSVCGVKMNWEVLKKVVVTCLFFALFQGDLKNNYSKNCMWLKTWLLKVVWFQNYWSLLIVLKLL